MVIHAFTKGVVFFGYAGKNLAKYEVTNPKQSGFWQGSLQGKVKNLVLFVVYMIIFFKIVEPYIHSLGTEKS